MNTPIPTTTITRSQTTLGHRNKYAQKPSDPAEAARRRMAEVEKSARARAAEEARARDPRFWGIDPELADLPSANDLDITPDAAGKIARAKRWDVFSLLRSTPIGPRELKETVLHQEHITAVDRLQRDIAIRHMTAGASGSGRASELPADFPLARIEAANRLIAVAERADAKAMKLLVDLSTPSVTRGEKVDWRKIVETVTGEHRKALQAGEVRAACDALVLAYSAVDSAPRARAA